MIDEFTLKAAQNKCKIGLISMDDVEYFLNKIAPHIPPGATVVYCNSRDPIEKNHTYIAAENNHSWLGRKKNNGGFEIKVSFKYDPRSEIISSAHWNPEEKLGQFAWVRRGLDWLGFKRS